MNGYSKINTTNDAHKSRSIDFSDFFSFPQTPKLQNTVRPKEEPNQIKKNQTQNSSSSPERGDETGGEHGERFGVILGRCGSVSSASGFQTTVKRAFSMRRSSSVSERYCRIHDQYMTLASPIRDDHLGEDETGTRRSMKKKQRGGKILRACKRLIGL